MSAQSSTVGGPLRSVRSPVLKSARGPVLIALVVVAVAVIVALLTPRGEGDGRLDPRSAKPDGAKALVQVLRGQGVDVDLVTDSRAAAQAAPGSTVLVDQTSVMAREQVDRLVLAGAARLVLITPQQEQLDGFAPGIEFDGVVEPHVARPGCTVPDAVAAGPAAGGGAVYRFKDGTGSGPGTITASDRTPGAAAVSGSALCYPEDDGGSGAYARTRSPAGTDVIVLGRPGMLSNQGITDDGNAALALRTLGNRGHLVWYTADPLEPIASQRKLSLVELLPGWLPWVVGQLGLAVLAAMVWRGRRLGPLVVEPLPVIVRAAETQEGRARLYRQARARDRAADALRAAAARRLSHRLAGGTGGSARELVTEVAGTSGRRPDDVRALLLGPVPGSDLDLVKLADDLDRLESDVARARAAGPGRTTDA